ncbi:MAG TPA: hypothetical protein VJM83_01875 [Nitrospirota bacterium]|nr:hypothetical protein [Nitrospirota bacterium]
MRQKIRKTFSISTPIPSSAISAFEKIVAANKGKILRRDGKGFEAAFGSRIYIRLFGTYIWHNVFKNPLPTILSAEINDDTIIITLTDNLGWYLFIDPICKSSYEVYFGHLEKALNN